MFNEVVKLLIKAIDTLHKMNIENSSVDTIGLQMKAIHSIEDILWGIDKEKCMELLLSGSYKKEKTLLKKYLKENK